MTASGKRGGRRGGRHSTAAPDDAQLDLFDASGAEPPSAQSIDAFDGASGAGVLAELTRWAEAGWLRRLDAAFARFVAELDPAASPMCLLAAAMTAHMEGRGHACLDLAAWLSSPDDLLGWKPEASVALRVLLLRLSASDGVIVSPGARASSATLVAEAHAGSTADTPMRAWHEALRATSVVLCTAESAFHAAVTEEASRRPLVLDGGKLYLRRYSLYECRVADQVTRRVSAGDGAPHADHAGGTGDSAGASSGPDPEAASMVKAQLDRLFDATTAPDASSTAIDWQRIACAVALRGRLSIITGGPGTGKTYTVARLLALLFGMAPDATRLRVALAAPTGKAAARLKLAIDVALTELEARLGDALPVRALAGQIGPAKTLHSLLGARSGTRFFQHDARRPLDVDVLVVDEASMVHLEMMDALLAALPPQARLILLGDKDQLASVEAGAVLGDLCEGAEAGGYDGGTRTYVEAATGQAIPSEFTAGVRTTASPLNQQTVMLRVSRRFGGPIGRLAAAVNAGDVEAARAAFKAETGMGRDASLQWQRAASPQAVVGLASHGRDGAPGGYRAYLELLNGRGAGPHDPWVKSVLAAFDRFRVLCAVREGAWGVVGLNADIEKALGEAGLLSAGGEWYEGRPVLVTRNDYAAGVFNGDVGIALKPASGGSLRVYFADGETVRSVMASRLADVETAFAMTVHKSQGSEFDHTVLALPSDATRASSRELVYTGVTRARSFFTLVTPEGDAFEQALARRTRRASGLPALLAARAAGRRPARSPR